MTSRAAATGPAQASPVDWPVLEARYGARPGALGRIVEVALDSIRPSPAQLRTLAGAGDLEELRRAAHSLSGGARAIAAERVGVLAAAVEAGCRADPAQAIRLAAELAAAVDAMITALEQWRAAQPHAAAPG